MIPSVEGILNLFYTKDMRLYSIIIPVYNRPDELDDLLSSLCKQTYVHFEVIVVEAGYRTRLFPSAWVYHKRRTDLMQFFRQVRHSGEARIALNRKHPGSLKLVHCLPALFTFSVCLLVISSFFCRLFLVPLIIYALLLFVDAMFRNKCDLRVGSLSVIASFTQLFGYGTGFLRSII